jgi:hypothetical protein
MPEDSFFRPQADAHYLGCLVTGLFCQLEFFLVCHGLVLRFCETYFPKLPQEPHAPVLQPPAVCRTGRSDVILANEANEEVRTASGAS